MRPVLPIDALLPEIRGQLERRQNLILQASPGSGKTTRVPPFLLESGLFRPEQEILVLVPRRLAAKLAAFRVAEEMGEKVGERVGYQFRFEKALSARTRLSFLTEGLLLRRLLHEPKLPRVAAVILDEFHERHLHSDLALSYLRWLQAGARPDLRLIVMSATLKVEPLRDFLDASVLQLDQGLHPVETWYRGFERQTPVDLQVKAGVGEVLRRLGDQPGDILVFLPGMAEIRRAETALRSSEKNLKILPLHGDLPREEQDKVFRKYPERKIILATNVAESSLTIDGVRAVIDTGLHRQSLFSWWSGIPTLKTKTISKASAIQRAGRAGRTGPGLAMRLYSQSDFQSRAPFDPPEIQRVDLAQSLLELIAMPGLDWEKFTWFEAPPAAAVQAGLSLLADLGAIVDPELNPRLTAVGKRMAELPLHPRLSRILLEAESRGVLPQAARLVAKLSEADNADLDALAGLQRSSSESARRLEQTLLGQFSAAKTQPPPAAEREAAIARSALAGYPDRVAKRRARSGLAKSEQASQVAREYDLVFASGGAGTVSAEGVVAGHELFVILDAQERQGSGQLKGQLQVRSLVPIEEEWLLDMGPTWLKESDRLAWDPAGKRVWRYARLQYGDLVLDETRKPAEPGPESLAILLKEGLGLNLERLLSPQVSLHEFLLAFAPVAEPELLESALVRMQLLVRHFPEAGIGPLEDTALKSWVMETLQSSLSLKELKERELAQEIFSKLAPEWRGKLEQLLPTQLSMPSGRRAKIHYAIQQQPWIESRLQDFFGWRQGPTILNGRLPLTVHLLAPNQRALQVTQDLNNFWNKIYPSLRTQLSRRYPRHQWPEDPSKPVSHAPQKRKPS